MSRKPNQPHATGRARIKCEDSVTKLVVTITLSRGDEIGFAIGAMNWAGFKIAIATPSRLTLAPVGRRRLPAVAEALRGAGFRVAGGR